MLSAKEKKSNFIRKTMEMRNRNATVYTIVLVLVSASIAFADIDDGLVGYWSFDNPSNLGHDDSGTGNNGYPMGGASPTSGVVGGAVHSDGSGYIRVPDSPSLDLPGGSGSISAFIRVDPSSDEFGIVAKESSSSYSSTIAYEFAVRYSATTETFLISDGPTANSINNYSGASLKDSLWHHVAVTWSGSGGKVMMYRDGIKILEGNQTISTINNTSDPILIGAFRWNVSGIYRKFTGDMDEVRIYNRALSEDEIRELAFGDSKVDVDIDIKPGSCPNPLNVKDKGVLPVAVLGSADFDVFSIDPASIRLEGVAPVRSSYEDVATPVSDKTDDCDCTTEGPGSYIDLVLKFDTQEIVAALGGVYDGDVYLLTLTGEALDGTPIEGTDCIVIIAKGGK